MYDSYIGTFYSNKLPSIIMASELLHLGTVRSTRLPGSFSSPWLTNCGASSHFLACQPQPTLRSIYVMPQEQWGCTAVAPKSGFARRRTGLAAGGECVSCSTNQSKATGERPSARTDWMPHVGQGLAYLPTESNVENETRLFMARSSYLPASFFYFLFWNTGI